MVAADDQEAPTDAEEAVVVMTMILPLHTITSLNLHTKRPVLDQVSGQELQLEARLEEQLVMQWAEVTMIDRQERDHPIPGAMTMIIEMNRGHHDLSPLVGKTLGLDLLDGGEQGKTRQLLLIENYVRLFAMSDILLLM
jgi:hypothetical protein